MRGKIPDEESRLWSAEEGDGDDSVSRESL
jgi:hypothetical protein